MKSTAPKIHIWGGGAQLSTNTLTTGVSIKVLAAVVDTPIVSVFVESWAPPPQMWIFGAVDFTAALAKVAKVLGYRVLVCDAREIFATRRRFPMADEVRVTWPGPVFADRGQRLTGHGRGVHPHPRPEVRRSGDPGCARHRVGYIGVMGSRTTHASGWNAWPRWASSTPTIWAG